MKRVDDLSMLSPMETITIVTTVSSIYLTGGRGSPPPTKYRVQY